VVYQSKDRNLIRLLPTEKTMEDCSRLLNVLQPFKEATNLVSKNGEAFMIAEALPVYAGCTGLLTQIAQGLPEDDSMKVGINAAVTKLNHYYDIISPIAGIAILLNPSRKKVFFKTCLSWKPSWIEAVMSQFESAYEYYQKKIITVTTVTSPPQKHSMIAGFLRSQQSQEKRVDDECARYISIDTDTFLYL
jgi:hypothetical protein